MDDVPGSGRELRRFWHEGRNSLLRPLRSGQRLDPAEESPQAERAHPHAAPAKKLAPGQKSIFETWRVMWHLFYAGLRSATVFIDR